MSRNAASNAIPMREVDRSDPNPQEAQFERLLKECQSLAVERLSRSVSVMLDKAEDTLWALADLTHERELRDLYIAAKEKALEKRELIGREFRSNYLAEFGNRVHPDRKQHQDFSRFDMSTLELGLVNDEDLEETIKVNEMAAKLRPYCEEELNALDQRVGVLIGDANLHGEGNPFSPQAICNAYRQTCLHIEASLKIRMIFHKLFDDHVLDDVRSIYKDLNTLLIERSILPKIHYGVRRAAGGIGARPAMPVAGAPGTAMAGVALPAGNMVDVGYGADPIGVGEQDFYAMLQGLVAMNIQAGQFGTGAPGGAGLVARSAPGVALGAGPATTAGMVQVSGLPPTVGGPASAGGASALSASAMAMAGTQMPQRPLRGAELIGSLTRLQQGDMGVVVGSPTTLDASVLASGTTNVVRELKSTQLGTSVDQSDGTTMDIVAMLFDQIFGDKRIPYALKVLIGRLQIPVVKVAVLDKKFFSKKSHPARRLLDTLGEFAFGMDENFDQNSPVYKKLEDIVQRLLDSFEDDIGIFETLHADLLALVQEENQRAENAAKEAARKIAYMERLEVAKAVAQFEIKKRAETTRIPQLVLKFLADEWVKLLLLAHARYGKDSDAWKSALETMDLLIWSANQKQSLAERRKLAAMLPGLLKRLLAGLQGAGTKSDSRKQFFSRLMRVHTKVISGYAAPTSSLVATLSHSLSPAIPQAAVGQAESLAAVRGVHQDALSGLEPPTLPRSDFTELSSDGQSPEQVGSVQRETTGNQVSAQAISSLPERTLREAGAAAASEIDQDAEPATQAPAFSNVTIKNPFGDGDIEIEEISLSDLPGVPELSAASRGGPVQSEPADQHSQSVTNLREGDWLEFHDDDGGRIQAKLSYISPLKGTYLFVDRQGGKAGEYSLYQLAREFRTGRAMLLERLPLLDRAMSSLVGALKKNAKHH